MRVQQDTSHTLRVVHARQHAVLHQRTLLLGHQSQSDDRVSAVEGLLRPALQARALVGGGQREPFVKCSHRREQKQQRVRHRQRDQQGRPGAPEVHPLVSLLSHGEQHGDEAGHTGHLESDAHRRELQVELHGRGRGVAGRAGRARGRDTRQGVHLLSRPRRHLLSLRHGHHGRLQPLRRSQGSLAQHTARHHRRRHHHFVHM